MKLESTGTWRSRLSGASCWRSQRGSPFPATILEVDFDRLGRPRALREGYVGIRANQIERVAGKPGCRVCVAPFEHMKRQLMSSAPVRQVRTGIAVQMHLPVRSRALPVSVHRLTRGLTVTGR